MVPLKDAVFIHGNVLHIQQAPPGAMVVKRSAADD